MNFLHSVLFAIKMGSEFSLLIATRLSVSKIDPEVIGSSRKMCEMLPSLSPNILYHHILLLSKLRKHSESALLTHDTQGMVKTFSFAFPFEPGLLKCLIYSVLEGEHKSTKNRLSTGVTIEGDAAKNVRNTNLLVVMRVRLSQ